ncbi:MAG: OmpA family protein [Bdellovibrio sp.]|nr:OmpA family protein [Bdellovibrio sp.]
MNSLRVSSRKRIQDDGEKPFWISFSDLMTALMVLFLVATTVALMAATKKVNEVELAKNNRDRDIKLLMEQIEGSMQRFPGIKVRGHSVDFGERANFKLNKHDLTEEQSQRIRDFIPVVLTAARSELGKKWIKRVIVEGFASKEGSYIHNLNLSMQRSERVLCVLLSSYSRAQNTELSEDDRLTIRELFLVGGSSFNSLRESDEASRRIELKLEFLDSDEQRGEIPSMPLDNDPQCPLDKSTVKNIHKKKEKRM